MNKKNILFVLPALALLASCGANIPGSLPSGQESQPSTPASNPSQDSSDPSETQSEPSATLSDPSSAHAAGWTDEEKALMNQYLNNRVLPYYDGNLLDVYYDSDYETLSVYYEWSEDIAEELVSVYEDENYYSYTTSYFGLEIFIATIYDESNNNIYVTGMELYEDEDDTEPSYYCLDASYYYSQADWPTSDVAAVATTAGSSAVVPSFAADAYIVSGDEEALTIECIKDFEEGEAENSYKNTLQAAGWTIDDTYYDDGYGYFAYSTDEAIEIEFYEEPAALIIYICANENGGEESSSSTTSSETEEETNLGFPSSAFSDWLSFLGATATTIPEYTYAGTWTRDRDYEDNGWTYWYFEDDSLTIAETEEAYVATLEAAGYVIDDSKYEEYGYYAYLEDDCFELQFYYYGGEFLLGVGPYEAPEPIEEGEFDFSVETQITSKSATSTTWESGEFKFVVEKNEGTINVGNGSYFSDPLRLYKGHKVTISWSETTVVESIIVDVDNNSKSSGENLTSATFTGCTASASGDIITLTPNSGVNSISFVITANQCHLNGISIVVAE